MDAPEGAMERPGMEGDGAAARAKPDAARAAAQGAFMKVRRLAEEADRLRAKGAGAERTTLAALRTRFDRVDRALREITSADPATQQRLHAARAALDAADRVLIDVRLSLDLERAKQAQKKQPAPAEDF